MLLGKPFPLFIKLLGLCWKLEICYVSTHTYFQKMNFILPGPSKFFSRQHFQAKIVKLSKGQYEDCVKNVLILLPVFLDKLVANRGNRDGITIC